MTETLTFEDPSATSVLGPVPRPPANLRLAQPLPVGPQDPCETKGRTASESYQGR